MNARYLVLALLAFLVMLPRAGFGANGANFVLYNHHTARAGEREVMFMSDLGQEADGTRYTAQMIELELGVTDRWTSELMIEGQATFGQGGYHFTGIRWENRYRLFEYGTFLNPVVYSEYENLGEDTKYAMEIAGREDATVRAKARPRERVLETRIILGHDINEGFNVAVNWINESDLDTGVTSFGYAVGLNYKLASVPARNPEQMEGAHGDGPVIFGLELFGALGDSDKGITADPDITQHYLSPNVKFHVGDKAMVKLGWAIGLTNVSQDIFRTSLGYEF